VYLANKLRGECEKLAQRVDGMSIDVNARKEREKRQAVEMREIRSENTLLRDRIASLEDMFCNFDGAGVNLKVNNNKKGEEGVTHGANSVITSNTEKQNALENLLIAGGWWMVPRKKKKRLSGNKPKKLWFYTSYDLGTLIWKKQKSDENVKGTRDMRDFVRVEVDEENKTLILFAKKDEDSIVLEMCVGEGGGSDFTQWVEAFKFAISQ